MSTCKWPSLLIILLFCFACDKPLPVLEGMDLDRWRQDKNGCNHVRVTMREAIGAEKEKLLALNQMQIVSLLGKPDQNELSSRNQKFFYYFIGPAPACGVSADSAAAKLVIRFNAMGLAKEVAVE